MEKTPHQMTALYVRYKKIGWWNNEYPKMILGKKHMKTGLHYKAFTLRRLSLW